MGIFNKVSAIIIEKPVMPKLENAPFDFNDLIMKVVATIAQRLSSSLFVKKIMNLKW